MGDASSQHGRVDSLVQDRNAFPTQLKGKRILLASESLGPINGVSRTTTKLIQHLQSHGVEMKLVAPHYVGEKSRPPPPVGPIRRLGGFPLPYSPELSIAYPFRLDRICAKFKPDLVYLASPASVGFQVLLQIRCLPNPPPVIANFQTDLSAYAKIIFPPPLDSYGSWLLETVEGYLFNYPSVHHVFYPSSPVHHYLTGAGVPKEKLQHIGRGVDTELFCPQHRDEEWRKELAPNGEIILVCVGRLAPEKGFPFLAKVAKALADRGVAFKLVIVGGNRNPSVEDEVRHAFDPVKDRVVFTGFLEGVQLARAYASADLFCHCSVTETFGLVVLEAMACGLPVIARDAGGPSEIVVHDKTGYLTPPDDLEIFVNRVRLLAGDSKLRDRMATEAREEALRQTWDRINNRVAWYLADSIERTTRSPMREFNRNSINWAYALICTIWVEAKFTGAMVIVSLFWVIAVLPLLIHGNTVFSGSQRKPGQPLPKSSSAHKMKF
jgi:glycosyltransferase involved in cell wall biosynthesis